MAITLNAKGTTNPFFKIGRRGTTLYQGTADPSITYTILQSDIWLDTTSNSLKFRNDSNAWIDSASYNDTDVTAHLSQFDSNILPDTDDAYTLGNATNRWQNLYASNGTIDTLTVSGDLVVSGAVTTIDTQNLTVADNIIILNNDVTGTPTEDAGLEIERGTATNVSVAWNESTDRWSFTNDGTTYFNLAVNTDDITEGSSNLYYTNARFDARLALTVDTITNAPTAGQILVWDAVNSKFIPSNNVSVGADAVASGSGAINYNSATGVLTYTPPDLSSYIASVAFSDITSKPTTIAGYGITDAFSGAYTDLTGKPTLPTSLLDLNITDGTVGQILVTNGNGAFSFATLDISDFTDGSSLLGNSSYYATKVGYNLADETDTSSIVLNPGDAVTPATFRGDVINNIGTVIVDVSSTSVTFSGGLAGNVYGDVYNPTGANKILESGTGNLDSSLTVDTANATTLNATTTNISVANISGIATFTGGSADFTGTTTIGNWNGAVYDRTGSTLIIEDDATPSPIVHANLDGDVTGTVTGSLNGTVTGILYGDHHGDVTSPTSLVPIITTGPVRDTLTIHDAHIDKIKAPGTNGATILNTSGATTLSGHNVHLTGSLYGDIGDTLANDPVLTVGTGNNDSQLSVTTASIDELSVENITGTGNITTTGALTVTGDITTTNGTVTMDRLALSSTQTTVSPLQLTAGALQDGVGALRIDSVEPDIYLNDTNSSGHSTVTFATMGTAAVAIGKDSSENFYITVRDDNSNSGGWRNDTLVIDNTTGNISLGYDQTVGGTITQGNTDYYTKQYVLSGTTTDATETELFVRGISNNRIPVATDTTIFYDISFVARRTDATGESAGLVLKGVVDNFSGTVADVGDLYEILVASDNVNLAVEAAADNTNDAIKVTVTGEASKTFRWTAIVKTTEVAQ